jgi:4-amino-4-deoxy-L-arabinose transferase
VGPALALVLTCGALGLMEPTDARYAEIGREMVASGDWLIPRLNGVTHLDKPPVAYWSAAAGMRVLGVNAAGARIGAKLDAVCLRTLLSL